MAEAADQESHVEECFGFACGVLGWDPASFWRATPGELRAACEAWRMRFCGPARGLSGTEVMGLRGMLDAEKNRVKHGV